MRDIAILFTDDLDRKTPATETVTLGFNGKIVVLDLSQEHYDELTGLLAPYLKAGQAPGEDGIRVPQKRAGRPTKERQLFLDGLRRYAEHVGKPLKALPKGGYTYSEVMEREFARAIADGAYSLDGHPTGKASDG